MISTGNFDNSRVAGIERQSNGLHGDNAGRASGILSVEPDLTEHKQTEEALRQSELRFRTIVETAEEGVWVIDSESKTSFANRKMAVMLGYAVEDMLGRTMFDFMDTEAQKIAQKNMERRHAGIREQHEFRLRSKQGADVWTTMATSPLYDADGNFSGALAMVTDITERKRVEVALQTSEQRLSLAIAASSQGLWDWNLVTGETYLSPEYWALTGYAEGEIHSAPTFFTSLVHPDDLAAVAKATQEHLQGHTKQCIIEYRLKRKPDEYAWVRGVGCITARDVHGAPLRMSGVVTEISEQKQAEAALRAAIASRDSLLAIVSHDLRSPLSAIQLSTGMLAQGLAAGRETNTEILDMILSSTKRMGRLIDDLLQAATIEAGRFTVEPKSEETFSILEEAAQALTPLATVKSVRVEKHASPGLPRAYCDRLRVIQVLTNLIGNAIKFSPAGGEIGLRVWAQPSDVCFAVSDNGSGIADDVVPHIFDRYWKGKGKGQNGVGLGLFIAKGIVEAHGGRIWVERRPESGCTFFFTLPIARIPAG